MINDCYTLGRNDEFPLENFKKGVKVWIKDVEKVWISGELLEDLTFASSIINVRNSKDDVIFLRFVTKI